jgi:CheY-like chemotaxis protein
VPHTLLLADDSVTIQRVIELTFADEDIKVIAVSDGDQAIERLGADPPPDIVLADIGMPGKNGYEVAQYMRESPRLAHIPVVLLTGAFEPVDQARAAEAGCDGVLAKPFEPQLVIGRVKELLARPRRTSPDLDVELPPPPSAAVEQWAPPLDQALTAVPAPPAAELNDYFDRLDAAFANLASPAAPQPVQPIAPPPAADAMDWFSPPETPAPVTDHWDLPAPAPPAASPEADLSLADGPRPAVAAAAPLAPAAPTALVEPVEPIERLQPPPPVAPVEHVAAPRPAGPSRPTTLPSLPDAFAALLAAEQGEPPPTPAPAWPASAPSAPAITDDLVEDVTRRVLERLSDRVVRETVEDIASKIAERLVREEIERIKASIK